MKKKSKVKAYLQANLAIITVAFVALLCAIFLVLGTPSENGSITLDGNNAKISEATEQFIEDANAALFRLMNEDQPTDEETISANSEPTGQGFYTTIDDILARRKPDGFNDNGLGLQCSKYTAYLGTGKMEYSTAHPDFGPVNGKDIAKWLVKNYDYKYIDEPVAGAIGSGGFNTLYGHTAMYLYSTGTNTAMVNDANYVPLAVATHNMNIDGWVWVVPSSYEPEPEPTPEPEPEPVANKCETWLLSWGDTLGKIMLECEGKLEWGVAMDEYAKTWADMQTGVVVYDGWHSASGIGLYAGHTIVKL